MSISTRIDPIGRDIALIIDQDLSPEAQSRFLAAYAAEEIAAAEEQNEQALGRPVGKEIFVDGQRGAALTEVRPNGVIVAEFDLVADVLSWIGQQLVLASPVRSGRYANSHVLYADGVEVDWQAGRGDAAEYIFANVQPYARKIERGLSSMAPDGVYQAVAAVAARRFGNVAAIKFTYRTMLAGGGGRAAQDAARGSRSPAIQLRLR